MFIRHNYIASYLLIEKFNHNLISSFLLVLFYFPEKTQFYLKPR